jgi:formate dehydrogenase maturation protein FdhE
LLGAVKGDCAKGVPLVTYSIPKRKFTKNGAVLSKLKQNEGFKELYLRFLQAVKFGIFSVVWDLEQMSGIPNTTNQL